MSGDVGAQRGNSARAGFGVQTIADQSLLKTIWRRYVRNSLRAPKFEGFNLVADPIHYAAYEWGLEALTSGLARDLTLGRYAPERGEIVRMAKGNGLTRPLLFLSARDALVYRTITALVESQLVSNSPSWVGFSRHDKGRPAKKSRGNSSNSADLGGSRDGSIDWFEFWLRRNGLVKTMIEADSVSYLVESDVANFYPSIRLEAVREQLLATTTLSKEVVRLCVQIIDGVMPRQDYSEVSLMGLPQEQVGSSRAIAHSLLQHVDEEFNAEGAEGRYSRFMDDILVGVGSIAEGERCIARFQKRLESIGLYPNSSKTRIVPIGDYLESIMADQNAEIDRINSELDATDSGHAPHFAQPTEKLLSDITELSDDHRSLKERPRRWGRVMRRIYTLQRRAGMDRWWQYWEPDILEDPGSAGSVLEYVRCWPMTASTAEQLSSVSRSLGDLYPDVAVLAAETIATAPNASDWRLWRDVFRVCNDEVDRLLGASGRSPETERVAASWLVAAWKFGNEAQRHALLSRIPHGTDSMSPVRAQALSLLASAKRSLDEWVAAKPGLAWADAMAAEYLRSLLAGEEKAIGVGLSLIRPQLRLMPQRFITLPRTLPILIILGGQAKAQKRLYSVAPKHLRDLQRNPSWLRDHRIESEFMRWCP